MRGTRRRVGVGRRYRRACGSSKQRGSGRRGGGRGVVVLVVDVLLLLLLGLRLLVMRSVGLLGPLLMLLCVLLGVVGWGMGHVVDRVSHSVQTGHHPGHCTKIVEIISPRLLDNAA